jgi:hypothetical protein
MHDLEQAESEPAWAGARFLLIASPIIATIANLYIAWYWEFQEPFGGATYQDFGVMVLGPILLLGMWLHWFWMAYRLRLQALVWGSVLLWALLTLFVVSYITWDFFHSPWAYYKPPGGRGRMHIFRTD